MICIINSQEDRYVATINTPNTFVQTKVDKEEDIVNIRVRRYLIDLLLEIYLELYKLYIIKNKNGNNILILICLNSINGKMVESLLCYQKFCKALILAGFKLNPYDTCVANRMVNRKHQKMSGVWKTASWVTWIPRSIKNHWSNETVVWDHLQGSIHKDDCEFLEYTQVSWNYHIPHNQGTV